MTTDTRITEATMYPYQSCGETKKTSLSDDDLTGVCAIYPKAKDPGTCEVYTTTTGCCDASGAPATGSVLAAMFVLVALRRRRPVTSAR
jgi:uncharacterized protein (TIGR03382 family)